MLNLAAPELADRLNWQLADEHGGSFSNRTARYFPSSVAAETKTELKMEN